MNNPCANNPCTPATAVPSSLCPYALRKDLGLWHITFAGQTALIKHERGLFYVAWLLLHPPAQPIHGMALALKVMARQGKNGAAATEIVNAVNGHRLTIDRDAALDEHNLRLDEVEAAAVLRRRQLRLEAMLEDEMESDQMKAEAIRELEAIYAFEKANRRRVPDVAQKAVRSVRMAIKRLHRHLAEATDAGGNPHPVFVPFAAHLQDYLLVPSARYSGPNGRWAKTGVAGCFTYEPPEGVVWVEGDGGSWSREQGAGNSSDCRLAIVDGRSTGPGIGLIGKPR